jgi:hypothetical protein
MGRLEPETWDNAACDDQGKKSSTDGNDLNHVFAIQNRFRLTF